jgi:serine/threonine protein kinase
MTYPPESQDFEDLYIVTELFEADLSRILSSKQALQDAHAVYFVYQLLRGLKYLHSAGVLHRDLKPSNLLVNSNCDLAICDLGLARGFSYEPMSDVELTRYVQTRWYRSPELLCQATMYGPAMDMWSVGCILGEILARRPILQGSSTANELGLIIHLIGTPSDEDLAACHPSEDAVRFVHHLGHMPGVGLHTLAPSANPMALDLLSRMLVFNPDKRISVDEAIEHPFLAELHARAPPAPTCHAPFDFSYEAKYAKGKDIPKEDLQELIFTEVLALRQEQAVQAQRSAAAGAGAGAGLGAAHAP